MDKIKVVITGANGMLGSTLSDYLKSKDYNVVSTDRDDFDITRIQSISENLEREMPQILINCAAYTNVDGAEEDIDLSNLLNGHAVGYLASECKMRDIKFLHISTDYVFGDNSSEGYMEDDIPQIDSLNQYGKSKYLGEKEALRLNKNSYILRTSWIFGPNGKNFVDTMIRLGGERDELSIVSDEWGVPTYTLDISRQIEYILKNDIQPGTYHIVNEGVCSRYELAKKVFELKGLNLKVNEMKLADYQRKAKIANYSVLVNTKLPKLQSWEKALKEYLGKVDGV